MEELYYIYDKMKGKMLPYDGLTKCMADSCQGSYIKVYGSGGYVNAKCLNFHVLVMHGLRLSPLCI